MKLNTVAILTFIGIFALGSARAADKKPVKTPPVTTTTESAGANSASEKVSQGDKVVVTIVEDPVAGVGPVEVLVDPKSNLHFTVSRGFSEEVVINAENKTIAQIQKELKEKLDATYYHNATVSVAVGAQALQPGKITITGPVRNNFVALLPGERKKLLDTILQAGPSEFANLKKIKLMRIDPVTGKNNEQIINVEAIKKDPTKDILVKDGDRLDLPEKNIIFQ